MQKVFETRVGAKVPEAWIHFQTDQLKASRLECAIQVFKRAVVFAKCGIDPGYQYGDTMGDSEFCAIIFIASLFLPHAAYTQPLRT